MSEKPIDLEKLAQQARDTIYKKGKGFYEQLQHSPRKEKFQRKIDLKNLQPPSELEGALRPMAVFLIDVIEEEDCPPFTSYLVHLSKALRLYASAVRKGYRMSEEDEYIIDFLRTYDTRLLFLRRVTERAIESQVQQEILDRFLKTGELILEEEVQNKEIPEKADVEIQYPKRWGEKSKQYTGGHFVLALDEASERKANSLIEKIDSIFTSQALRHTQMPSSDEFSADYLERLSEYFSNYFAIIKEQYQALRRAGIDVDTELENK